MTCAFCPNPSAFSCAWPVERYRVSRVDVLQPGDYVQRVVQKRATSNSAVVTDIKPAPYGKASFCRILDLAILNKDAVPFRHKAVNCTITDLVRVRRIGPCGVRFCDLHGRELSDARAYCKEHWNSWEAA